MLLLGDLGQQLDIRDTQAALRQMSEQLRETRHFDRDVARNLDQLARENAELKLYLAAVTRLLVAKGVITRDELTAVVETIDRADGKSDGGYSGPLTPGT